MMIPLAQVPSKGFIVATLLLAGCTFTPSSGPDRLRVVDDAKVHATASVAGNVSYAVVDISSSILPYFNKTSGGSLRRGLEVAARPLQKAMLGVGDKVKVTIFESQAGGLFIPSSSTSSGNFVTLPEQDVDSDGTITVPYVGAVKVAGRQVTDVQTEIQEKLANRAIEPQVVITTSESRSNRLAILGDVNSPSELDVNPSGERVLDTLSRAGGLKYPPNETYVTVTRNGRSVKQLFTAIVADPDENIYLEPGDVVFISRERRTFLALGALGLNGRLDFDESDLTLGEALAKAGGLLDSRADPGSVFLYRVVPRNTLVKAGLDVSKLPGDNIPVVFKADMRDPGTLFAIQHFAMQDKDVIYVSNAPSIALSNVLDVINGVSDTTSNVAVNAADAKDAVQDLAN